MTTEIEFCLPPMHRKQHEAFYSPARFVWIEGSTKCGKTVGAAIWLLRLALEAKPGEYLAWVAPVAPQAQIAWRRLEKMLPPEIAVCKKGGREEPATIEIKGAGKIFFYGSDRPDSIYGEDYVGACVEEASRCKEEAWTAIRSTVTATGAPVRIFGNVKGKNNWFYRRCRAAEQGLKHHAHFKLDAWDSVEAGIFPREEIEEAQQSMTPERFAELYLCIASEDGSNPFGHNFLRRCKRPSMSGKPVVAWGIDFARGKKKKANWTVMVGLDEDGQLADFDRFQGPWPMQYERIWSQVRAPALCDATGPGDVVVENLQTHPELGDLFEGYVYSPGSKMRMYEELERAIQYGEIGIFHDNALPYPYPSEHPNHIMRELTNMEYTYTQKYTVYHAPDGNDPEGNKYHDDCCDALAMANLLLRDYGAIEEEEVISEVIAPKRSSYSNKSRFPGF